MQPYLLLAPRGQAKTWEIIRHAINQSLGDKKSIIFVQSERMVKMTNEEIATLSKSVQRNIEVSADVSRLEAVSVDTTRYFDEFDFILGGAENFKIRPTDRFYGTPKFKRNLADWPEDDILFRILEKTKGFYESRMCTISYDKNLFQKFKGEEQNAIDELTGTVWEIK